MLAKEEINASKPPNKDSSSSHNSSSKSQSYSSSKPKNGSQHHPKNGFYSSYSYQALYCAYYKSKGHEKEHYPKKKHKSIVVMIDEGA